MSKEGPAIEFPNRNEFVSDIVVVDGRLVRPGDVLVDLRTAGREETGELQRRGFEPYDPRKLNPKTDWRQRPGAPPYGLDLNDRLRESSRIEIWHAEKNRDQAVRDQVELIEQRRVRGLHYNHVFVGADFYHGGPGGPPSVDPGPSSASLIFSFAGNQEADIAVLDNGMPAGWEALHGELVQTVTKGQVVFPLDQDPMDEDHDLRLDKQAGHGLFICGLIARTQPSLDVNLNRVLHASGEGEEALLIDTLHGFLGSSVRVLNLSLGGYLPKGEDPLVADKIRELVAQDKIVVASAGNAGDTDHGPLPEFPASMPEVIAVGAYNSTCCDKPKPWRKSCWGDVYAPGVDLLSTHVSWHGLIDWADFPYAQNFAGWAAWSGTSFAAPLVAAELAQLLATPHPGQTARQVVDAWLSKLPISEWSNKQGTGKAPMFEPSTDLTAW